MLLCSVAYPAVLLGIGQTLFRQQAQGSIVMGGDKAIGSRLIAQPFTGDEYFQPRPSAVSYNASASGGSNWAASNYQLRDRVARALGPIVKYRSGPKAGQLVAADVEAWFQQKPGLVKEWAQAHSTLAQNWVKADDLNKAYVTAWMKDNPDAVAEWVKANPGTPTPNPDDVAVPFFVSYSDHHPGTFPSIVEEKPATGASTKSIQPRKDGTDIQSIFFDTWRQEHADADLEEVPADLVMASGSGLDPHITLAGPLPARPSGRRACREEQAEQGIGAHDCPKGLGRPHRSPAGRPGRRSAGQRLRGEPGPGPAGERGTLVL